MSFESSFFEAYIIDVSKKKRRETNKTFKNNQEKDISLIRINMLRTITLIIIKIEDLVNNFAIQKLINYAIIRALANYTA
jgi:hypothetical protein